MKKSVLVSSLFVAATLASQSALAEVKVRAGVATSTYDLGGDYITAKSTYTPANVGLTFSSDLAANKSWYVDGSYSSGSGKHDGWTYLGTPSESFKRSDFALTGGVVFMNQNNGMAGNVYVGYKSGKTTLGANKAVLIARTVNTANTAWSEETFETSGVIVGGGASYPIAGGKAGSVGVNLGIGIMSATWKDNSVRGYNVKADTAVGGSLGANYTFPFSSNFGVVADLKYHSYNYKFGTANFTVREKITTLGASLYAKF